MSDNKFLFWNVRGLNSRASRVCVRDVVVLEAVSVVCLQETKVQLFSDVMISELLGADFDYLILPSVGASGGILVAWRKDVW
jgi:exonuclease III